MFTGYYITGFFVIPMGNNVTTCFEIEFFKYQGGGGGGVSTEGTVGFKTQS